MNYLNEDGVVFWKTRNPLIYLNIVETYFFNEKESLSGAGKKNDKSRTLSTLICSKFIRAVAPIFPRLYECDGWDHSFNRNVRSHRRPKLIKNFIWSDAQLRQEILAYIDYCKKYFTKRQSIKVVER